MSSCFADSFPHCAGGGSLPEGITGRRKGNIEICSAGRYFTVTGAKTAGRLHVYAECKDADRVQNFFVDVSAENSNLPKFTFSPDR